MNKRVWTQTQNSTNGQYACLWATDFREAPGRVVDAGGSSFQEVMLDPDFTSPHALIAISPTASPAQAVILSPGETYRFDRPLTRFYAWNALGFLPRKLQNAQGAFMYVGANLLNVASSGYVAFIVSTGGLMPRIRGDRPARSPLGYLGWTKADFFYTGAAVESPRDLFIAANVRGIRVSVVPLDVNNQAMLAPADFAVTLRPWVWAALAHTTSLATPLHGPNSSAALEASYNGGANHEPILTPNEEADLVVTQTSRTFERPALATAAAFGFQRVGALAGAGVASIRVNVEGY